MIRTETIIIDGREFIHTWSDRGVKIHGGFPEGDYDEVVDPAEFGRTYTETEIPVEESSEISDEEAFDILIGGE